MKPEDFTEIRAEKSFMSAMAHQPYSDDMMKDICKCLASGVGMEVVRRALQHGPQVVQVTLKFDGSMLDPWVHRVLMTAKMMNLQPFMTELFGSKVSEEKWAGTNVHPEPFPPLLPQEVPQ